MALHLGYWPAHARRVAQHAWLPVELVVVVVVVDVVSMEVVHLWMRRQSRSDCSLGIRTCKMGTWYSTFARRLAFIFVYSFSYNI